MATRAQCVVHRDDRVLMVRQRETDVEYWCLPGGRVEEGETPKQAALRELEEECGVRGQIVRELQRVVDPFYDRSVTFEVEIGAQERDRAFLWAAGLLACEDFFKVVEAWGDDISWPGGEP
jgi:ADP-ribose pyrophosphatase YjhB (NUDIX family)